MSEEPKPKSEDFEQLKSNVRSWSEELNLAGNQLVDKMKELTHEGNIRNVKVKHDGRVLFEIPLTAAVVGGVFTTLVAPQLAILGAIGGMIAHLTLEVEHVGEPPNPPNDRLSQ